MGIPPLSVIDQTALPRCKGVFRAARTWLDHPFRNHDDLCYRANEIRTQWKWENIWILDIGFGQVVFPLLLVCLTAPHAWTVFAAAKLSALAAAALFGMEWGIGNVLSGIGYTTAGRGTGIDYHPGAGDCGGFPDPACSLVPGATGEFRCRGPVSRDNGNAGWPHRLFTRGNLRQARQSQKEITGGADLEAFGKGKLRTGVVICVASGILSSMLNLAFTFGDNIRTTALRMGMDSHAAIYTLWLPIFLFGFLPILAYCIYLFARNRSGRVFALPGTGPNWFFGMLMGLLFVTGLSLYGIGSLRLGNPGACSGISCLHFCDGPFRKCGGRPDGRVARLASHSVHLRAKRHSALDRRHRHHCSRQPSRELKAGPHDGWGEDSMNPLEKVGIGRTNLRVTRLGFGTVPLGGLCKDVSEEEADSTVRQGLACGINYFDTAPIYGCGKAEIRLGLELAKCNRDSIVIATKVGYTLVPEDGGRDTKVFHRFDNVPPVRPIFDYSYDGIMKTFEGQPQALEPLAHRHPEYSRSGS
jgi:hypothetical protein